MANTHFNRVGSPSSGSPRLRETNKAKPKATPPVREKAVTAFNWPSTLRTPLPERNAKVLDAASSKTRAAKDVSPPLAKAEAAIPRAQESSPSLVRPHADPLPPLTQDLATEIALPEQPKKAKTKQSPSRERNIQLPAEPTVVERAAPQTPSLSALRTNQNQGPAAASQASQGHRQDTAITRAQPEPVASANPTWRSRLKDFASEAKQLAAYAWSGVKTVSSALQLGVYVAELAAVTVGWGLHKSFKAAYNLGAEFFGAKKIEASLRPVFGVCWDRVVKSASALASIGDAITDVGPTKPPEPADLGPADFQSALAAVTDVDSPADAAVTQPDPSTLNVLPAQGAAPSDLQNLERARGQMAQAAKVAKLAAARDKVVTRALAMGALVAGGVMTSMLLTPIAPPLAFVGLIVTWYLFKNARANLKTSITNRDLLLQGKPPLEVGHGAMGNAVHQWNLKRARKANGGKEVDAKTREDLSRKAAATGIHVNRLTTAFALGITLTTAFTASLAIVAVFAIRRGVQAVGQFIPWASDLYSDRRNRKAKETPLEVLNNTLGARLQAVDFQPDKLEKELVDELALWQIPPTDIAAHATKLQTWAAGGKKGKKPMLLLPTSGTAAKLTQAWHENNLGMALNVVAQAVVYAARSA